MFLLGVFDPTTNTILTVDKNGIDFLEHIDGNRYGLISEQEYCSRNGYEMIFDKRNLFNINGNCNSLIIENDYVITDNTEQLLQCISKIGKTKEVIITNFSPHHIQTLLSMNNVENKIVDHRFKNVIIDSIFKDRKQFFHVITKLFDNFTRCNFFIFSPNLLEVLNEEILKDEYNTSQNWNALVKTVINNRIYLCENTKNKDFFMTEILYSSELNFKYGYKRRFINEEYKKDDKVFKNVKNEDSEW